MVSSPRWLFRSASLCIKISRCLATELKCCRLSKTNNHRLNGFSKQSSLSLASSFIPLSFLWILDGKSNASRCVAMKEKVKTVIYQSVFVSTQNGFILTTLLIFRYTFPLPDSDHVNICMLSSGRGTRKHITPMTLESLCNYLIQCDLKHFPVSRTSIMWLYHLLMKYMGPPQ